jgi:hypothetical protein
MIFVKRRRDGTTRRRLSALRTAYISRKSEFFYRPFAPVRRLYIATRFVEIMAEKEG